MEIQLEIGRVPEGSEAIAKVLPEGGIFVESQVSLNKRKRIYMYKGKRPTVVVVWREKPKPSKAFETQAFESVAQFKEFCTENGIGFTKWRKFGVDAQGNKKSRHSDMIATWVDAKAFVVEWLELPISEAQGRILAEIEPGKISTFHNIAALCGFLAAIGLRINYRRLSDGIESESGFEDSVFSARFADNWKSMRSTKGRPAHPRSAGGRLALVKQVEDEKAQMAAFATTLLAKK